MAENSSGGLPEELRAAAEKQGCEIATSTQSTQQWINGRASWSQSTSFFKQCPGKSPEKIFESRSQGQGSGYVRFSGVSIIEYHVEYSLQCTR